MMTRSSLEQVLPQYGTSILLAITVLTGLYASSMYNYLLFHSFVETFSAVVLLVVFAIAWNTRHIQDNHYLLFIGIASLFAGFLGLLHTFAYKGMGVIPSHDSNLPTQLWLAFRYLFAVSLLLAPLFINRKTNPEKTFLIYFVVTIAVCVLIFTSHFPDCFTDETGLTQFKIWSEYVISVMFIGALVLFYYHRRAFDKRVLVFMSLSLVTSVLSELSFTRYVDAFGPANMVGHFFEITSFYCIYRAIIVTGVVQPSNLLFNKLKNSEEAIKKSHEELEYRIQERTEELSRSNNELMRQIEVRKRAETGLSRITRLYSVLSKVNEAIVRIDDPQKLYERVCAIAVEDGLFKMAWIGLKEPETLRVRPVACYGDVCGYLNEINIYAADLPEGRGPTGRAIFQGKYSISGNIEDDPTMLPWRDKALQHGFRSSAAFPFFTNFGIAGALTIYSGVPEFFTNEEIRLLMSLTDNIAFALDSISNEQKKMQAEESLRKINGELEMRVTARTAELAAANKELEAFAYSVSHDLRAPLRTIDGFTRAIEEEQSDKLDAIGKDYFHRIRDAAERMGQLIDALLGLSRLSRKELKRATVDLSALAVVIADELKKSDPDRRVIFTIQESLKAEGDPIMLRLVIENLFDNAWKFTSKQEAAQIEFGMSMNGGVRTYFVKDNGAGFDMAYSRKLFTVFQRLHTVSEFPGIGIGLATVQRIILRHGGRIWAEGLPNKGAVFFFTLG
jgi:signal transduction histidine kinase